MTVSTIQENDFDIYWLIEGSYISGLVQYLASLEHPQLEVLTVGDRGSLVSFREYGHDAPEVAHSFTNTISHHTQELWPQQSRGTQPSYLVRYYSSQMAPHIPRTGS